MTEQKTLNPRVVAIRLAMNLKAFTAGGVSRFTGIPFEYAVAACQELAGEGNLAVEVRGGVKWYALPAHLPREPQAQFQTSEIAYTVLDLRLEKILMRP